MRISRRTFVAATAAAAIVPSLGRANTAIDALYEAAKKEGEITWYIVPMSSASAERAGAAFTDRYPGVKVNVVRSTAQVAWQRLNQDIDTGVNNCDVLTTSNMSHAIDLKSRDLLAAYTPQRKNEVFEQFRGIDADDAFHVTVAGPMCMIHNTDEVPVASAPTNWTDLLDPKWAKRIAIGHPGFSGYVGMWAVKMQELYGWEFFEKLAELEPHIGRSSIDAVTTTAAGETLIGAGPAASSLISASKGNPIGNIYPTDGTVVITSPSGVMKTAPHPNAARLFSEFLLGEEYAAVVANDFGTPIRPGVALREGVANYDSIKVITASTDQMMNGIPEVAEKFRDTFGI